MDNYPKVVFVGSQSEFDNAGIMQEAAKGTEFGLDHAETIPTGETPAAQEFSGTEDFCRGVIANVVAVRAVRGRLLGGR